MSSKEIFFITSNQGKSQEVSALLQPLGYTVTQWDIGYPEVQADTLEEVVRFGLSNLGQELRGPTIIEDAGLFVDSLNGFPGVFSAFVQKTIGNEGILRIMEDVPSERRRARFKACLGFMAPGESEVLFSGECMGSISQESRGEGGFGYDPIFIPEGFNRTFAQMGQEEKNKISHRGSVATEFVNFLQSKD